MDRRSPCAVLREHMRSAPREALDPGQGEAMLGQALHEKPALRFSECSGQDSAELLIFPSAGGVPVWNFHQAPTPIQTFSTRA